MKIAVIGATGRIGTLTVAAARRSGHQVVEISRSRGIDVLSGAGLDDALAGVDAVVDTTSTNAFDPDEVVSFFTTATTNLLAAEQRAGVRHHVLLSIVGIAEHPDANAHYIGKVAQERVVESGQVPWTIVPATQFHDFAEMVSTWTEQDGSAVIAPLLVQPIAPADVAEVLAEVAAGAPQGRYTDIAGPHTEDLVDLARRTRAARGTSIRLVPTWDGPFGPELAGNALLPAKDARIMPTTFDDWLADSVS